jgi:hypothetical protein
LKRRLEHRFGVTFFEDLDATPSNREAVDIYKQESREVDFMPSCEEKNIFKQLVNLVLLNNLIFDHQ